MTRQIAAAVAGKQVVAFRHGELLSTSAPTILCVPSAPTSPEALGKPVVQCCEERPKHTTGSCKAVEEVMAGQPLNNNRPFRLASLNDAYAGLPSSTLEVRL